MKKQQGENISYHYARLDKLLEHRTRLAICVLLSRYDKINFSRFKELLGETDGSLGAQLRKLEDEAYVHIDKTHEGRRPVSWYSITDTGRDALKNHLHSIEVLFSGDLG